MKIGVQAIFKAVKDRTDGAGCTSVHQESKEQFFFSQIESQQDFFGSPGRMRSVHFSGCLPIFRGEQKKIAVHAAAEYFTAGDLCFSAFTWPEFRLAFQIDVPCRKEPLFDIGVDRTDRYIQLRMVRNNLIRRLSLIDQRGYQLVFYCQFGLSHIDTTSGSAEDFPVFAVGKARIVQILVGNGAFMEWFVTAITDIRSFVQSAAALLNKIPACFVAGRTGSALDFTEDNLAANISFPAMIPVDAEVVCIEKRSLVIPSH